MPSTTQTALELNFRVSDLNSIITIKHIFGHFVALIVHVQHSYHMPIEKIYAYLHLSIYVSVYIKMDVCTYVCFYVCLYARGWSQGKCIFSEWSLEMIGHDPASRKESCYREVGDGESLIYGGTHSLLLADKSIGNKIWRFTSSVGIYDTNFNEFLSFVQII